MTSELAVGTLAGYLRFDVAPAQQSLTEFARTTLPQFAQAMTQGAVRAGNQGGTGLSQGLAGSIDVRAAQQQVQRGLQQTGQDATRAGAQAGAGLSSGLAGATDTRAAQQQLQRGLQAAGQQAGQAGTAAGSALSSGLAAATSTQAAQAALRAGLGAVAQPAAQAGQQAGAALGQGVAAGAQQGAAAATGRLRDAQGRFVAAGAQAGQAAGDAAGQGVQQGAQQGTQHAANAIRQGLQGTVQPAGQAGAQAGEAFGEQLGELAKKAIGALGLAAALHMAMEAGDVRAKLQGDLDLTAEQAARGGKLAGELYASNYGEGLEDLADSIESTIGAVGGSMDNLTDQQIKSYTAFASQIGRVTDTEATEINQLVSRLLSTGLATSAQDAYDLIARGSQRTTKAMRGDLLEVANEYAVNFKSLGFSGSQAFSLIARASKDGAIAMDKVGDAVKEFGIRATDLGDTGAQQAMAQLGLNAQKAATDLLSGGKAAQTAFAQIVTGLQGVKDPAQQAALATALFGTPLEDLSKDQIPAFLASLTEGTKGLGDYAGAAQKLDDAFNSGPTAKMESLGRAALGVGQAVGASLLPVLDPLFGILSSGATILGHITDTFGALPEPIKASALALGVMVALRGPLTTMLTTLQANAAAAAIGLAGSSGIAGAAGRAAGGLSKFAGALAGPWGLAIGVGLTALISWATRSKEAVVSTADFSAAIDAQTGKLKVNSQELTGNILAQNGSLKIAREAGIDVAKYTTAVQGNSKAQAEIKDQLLIQAEAAVRNSDAWGKMVARGMTGGRTARDVARGMLESGDAGRYAGTAADGLVKAWNTLQADGQKLAEQQQAARDAIAASAAATGAATKAVSENDTILKGYRQGVVQTADAVAEAAKRTAEWRDATQTTSDELAAMKPIDHNRLGLQIMAGQLDKVKQAASDADTRLQYFSLTVDQLSGRNVDAEKATKLLNDQVRAVKDGFKEATDATDGNIESLIKNSGAIDTTTEAGSKLYDVVQNYRGAYDVATTAAYNNAVASGRSKDALKEARDAADKARDMFLKQADALGINKDAAVKMADQLGILEGKKLTDKNFSINATDNATKVLNDVQTKILNMNGKTVEIKVRASATSSLPATFAQGLVQTNADGGLIQGPGTGTSDSILSRVSNGEFIVRESQARKYLPLLYAINSGAVPGYAGGGLVNVAVNGSSDISAATDGVNNYLSSASSWAAKITAQTNAALAAAAAAARAAAAMFTGGSGVERWRPLATKVVQSRGFPLSVVDIMLAQMAHESSGNPQAINLYDSNARRGTPSKGLLQFIDPTFRAYAQPGYNTNIWDPESQMRAFLNYVPARYGSFDYLRRIGFGAYAGGGLVQGPGSSTSDSIAAYLSNREFVVNAPATARNLPVLEAINSGATVRAAQSAQQVIVLRIEGNGQLMEIIRDNIRVEGAEYSRQLGNELRLLKAQR